MLLNLNSIFVVNIKNNMCCWIYLCVVEFKLYSICVVKKIVVFVLLKLYGKSVF